MYMFLFPAYVLLLGHIPEAISVATSSVAYVYVIAPVSVFWFLLSKPLEWGTGICRQVRPAFTFQEYLMRRLSHTAFFLPSGFGLPLHTNNSSRIERNNDRKYH